ALYVGVVEPVGMSSLRTVTRASPWGKLSPNHRPGHVVGALFLLGFRCAASLGRVAAARGSIDLAGVRRSPIDGAGSASIPRSLSGSEVFERSARRERRFSIARASPIVDSLSWAEYFSATLLSFTS